MKKLTALFLSTALLFSATACTGSNNTSADTTDGTFDPTPNPTEITLNETYTLVYPSNSTDYEKAALDAIMIAMEHLGITVAVQEDTKPETPNEILVGKTNRAASQNALVGLEEGGFTLAVQGSEDSGYKIVLAANDSDGIELASRYFIWHYLNSTTPTAIPLSLSVTHKKASVSINGIPLSDYRIVYAKEGVGGDKDTQAAKYADTVKVFQALLQKATGVQLDAIPDGQNLTSEEHYILFGSTSRPEDNIVYSSTFIRSNFNGYTVKLLNNGNIALAGSNAASTLAAAEAAVYAMLGSNGTVETINRSGKKDMLRVACIGDSITYGTNSNDPSMQSYPVYLQRMLGYDYYVEKYGAPGHSLIETDTPSFLKHDYFKKSTNTKPDVVIVMLGTNDCRTQKWADSAYKDWRDPKRKEAFLASGQKLIDAYRKANPDVEIIFSTCPTVPQDAWLGTDWTARIRQYGNPNIKALAERNNCPVIDIYTYSTKHPEMFTGGDGLHPQNEQYEILAQGVYDMIKDVIKK